MHNNILEKYNNYLINSRLTPLLIELNKNDLNLFNDVFIKNLNLNKNEDDSNLGFKLTLTIAKNIFDSALSKKDTTNVIFIDADKKSDENNSILVNQLLEQIDDSLKKLYNLEIAKESIKSVLAYATKGLSNYFEINSYINKGIDFLVDEISNEIGNSISSDLINESVKKVINLSFDEINDKLHAKVTDKTINKFDNLQNTQLFISKNSKVKVLEDSKRFSNDLSNAELYQLIIKLIIDIAIDMPKLIFIRNPNKLDENSIALISLLLSVSKSLKDEDISIGLSIVYAYDDEKFQPYCDCEDKYKENKKLLDEQRIFAQRYAILARPTTNIPIVAVKSNMFVGRDEELKILRDRYYFSKDDSKRATMQVIAADPGIGKTKLIKRHIELIRKEEKNGHKLIQLTLLNNVGHNSLSSGLGSLINSILEEAERLDNIKKISQKIRDKAQEKVLDLTTESIKDIFGDNILNTGKTIINRYNLNEKIKDFSRVNIENKTSSNSKEEQFEKINQAIKKLELISDNSMPIVLFIDDLQWIDDASAEYVLNHFIRKFNVHIVSSLRASDANTMLSIVLEKETFNQFKIAIFQKAELLIDKNLNLKIDINKLMNDSNREFESKRFNLKGLDKNNLTNLISQVIQGTKEQQENLAISIIRTLANEEKEQVVNTLFAVETINMLCDEKFYNNTEKLILKNDVDSNIQMRFNQEIFNFKEKLKETFKTLRIKYEDAFNHPSNEKLTENFNLMAYAVLEERLNILQIYFKDYGNAAINTLLFSSLLGSPFSSSIVSKVVESIINTDEEFLQALKDEFKKSLHSTLNQIHYDVIEEIYEILSRYLRINNAYVYKHNLIEIFLINQLDYKLDLLFKKNKIKSKDKLYQLILTEIKKEKRLINNNYSILNNEEYQELEFLLSLEYTISDYAIKNNFDINTVTQYILITISLGKLYSDIYLLDKSRRIYENSLNYLQDIYMKGPINEFQIWFLAYSMIRNDHGITFKYDDNALELQKGLVNMFNDLKIKNKNNFYKNNPLLIREYFVTYIRYITMCMDLHHINDNLIKITKDLIKEIKIAKTKIDNSLLNDIYESLKSNLVMITKKGNITFDYDITDTNLIRITNHFLQCIENKKYDEIINISKEIFPKLEKEYLNNNLIWIKNYSLFCYYLSVAYAENNLIKEAINYNLKAVNSFEKLDKKLIGNYLLRRRYLMALILIINYYKNLNSSKEKEIYQTKAYDLFEEDKIFKEKNIDLYNQFSKLTNIINLNVPNISNNEKIARNEICPLCNSGKKYKKCCGKNS